MGKRRESEIENESEREKKHRRAEERLVSEIVKEQESGEQLSWRKRDKREVSKGRTTSFPDCQVSPGVVSHTSEWHERRLTTFSYTETPAH